MALHDEAAESSNSLHARDCETNSGRKNENETTTLQDHLASSGLEVFPVSWKREEEIWEIPTEVFEQPMILFKFEGCPWLRCLLVVNEGKGQLLAENFPPDGESFHFMTYLDHGERMYDAFRSGDVKEIIPSVCAEKFYKIADMPVWYSTFSPDQETLNRFERAVLRTEGLVKPPKQQLALLKWPQDKPCASFELLHYSPGDLDGEGICDILTQEFKKEQVYTCNTLKGWRWEFWGERTFYHHEVDWTWSLEVKERWILLRARYADREVMQGTTFVNTFNTILRRVASVVKQKTVIAESTQSGLSSSPSKSSTTLESAPTDSTIVAPSHQQFNEASNILTFRLIEVTYYSKDGSEVSSYELSKSSQLACPVVKMENLLDLLTGQAFKGAC